MLIKRNDNVKIIAGKDKGKTGKVVQVFPQQKKVVVEGSNTMAKHLRKKQASQTGQKLEFSAPLHVSNVKLICPKCSKETRLGKKIMKDAAGSVTKARTCKACGEVIE
jgi:large subunit ribosomal protein L24